MKLLLDTHAFLFAIGEPEQLSQASRHALLDASNDRFVSAASFWEIAIKIQTGRLSLPTDASFYQTHLRHLGAAVVPVEALHTFEFFHLPLLHKDPFDRLLVAQARVEGYTILTRDQWIPRYGVPVLW